MLNKQQLYLFGRIQTRQTGDQRYSDTSTYGECSRANLALCLSPKLPSQGHGTGALGVSLQKLFYFGIIALPPPSLSSKVVMIIFA